jgi:excisionase family DNA binding protein
VSARLLTPDDLAERWSVTKAQVWRLAREGRLPVVRIGRYMRFRVEAVEAFEDAGGAAADVMIRQGSRSLRRFSARVSPGVPRRGVQSTADTSQSGPAALERPGPGHRKDEFL